MKLIVNGCSFTWGAEIVPVEFDENSSTFINVEFYDNYRKSRTYAHHLHNKLHTSSYENLSLGGASNKRIIRTTLEYFMPKINNNEDVSDHIAVIQWSEPGRDEIYHDGYYYTLSSRGAWALPRNVDTLNNVYRDFIKGRIMLSDKYYEDQFMHDVIMMASFLELHKIKYVFCHITSKGWTIPDESYFGKINWLGEVYEKSSLKRIIKNAELKDNSLLTYPQRHPNPAGHKLIAEILYNRFKELYNL
jgi:hypothetical protein